MYETAASLYTGSCLEMSLGAVTPGSSESAAGVPVSSTARVLAGMAGEFGRYALEEAIHYVCIDVAEGGMQKGLRQTADYVEAETLPQAHCTLVRADHEIKLHGPKAEPLRMIE